MVQQVKVKLLPDAPVDEDAFGGHKRVAAAIARLVEREDGGKAIALEGGWGSGKSSIVRMLETRFEKAGPTADDGVTSATVVDQERRQDQERPGLSRDTRILVFDAWSHDGDPLRRVFLEELTRLCTAEFNQRRREYWEDRKKKEITGREVERDQTTTPVLKSKWPILVLAFASLYPVAIVALGVLLRQDNPEAWMLRLVVACVLTCLAPFFALLLLFTYLCINRTKDGLEAAGGLISLWSKKIDETTSTTAHETIGPTSIEFQGYFSDLVKEYLDKPMRRLVIVLDNLDRVPESTARTLWATLRLFADCCDNNDEWSKRIWFIVPYDRESAAALWDEDHKRQVDRIADHAYESEAAESADSKQSETIGRTIPASPSISAAFLDKTFQIRFVVPPLHIADWEDYLNTLVEKAMPAFGSDDERHRVYRLSERLAHEKGRPPSPRHLKLYVNDIGALARQFDREFPIDHLALYTIQRRQAQDIRLWITSGAFRTDPLVQVMPDETYVTSLLCIYFGTNDKRRAATLTLGGPFRQHLRRGEGDKIQELAQVPGFWNVAETELAKKLEDDEVKQDIILAMASAIDTGGLDKAPRTEYAHVIPAFATKVLRSANWEQLNEKTARAAEILLRIANKSDATNHVFSRLVSGEADNASVASKSKAWAIGTSKLVEVARSLGDEFRVVIPGDAAQAVRCLASIGRGNRGCYVLDSISCECPVAEVQSEVAPTAADEWTEEKSAALKTLYSTPKININWNDLAAPLSTRLQADAVAIAEAKRLLVAFFDVCERLPNNVKAACGKIAKHASFYVHVEKWSEDANVVASLVVLQVLARDVGRAASDPEKEKKGHAFLQTLFSSPDDRTEVIDEYLAIVIERPKFSLLSHTIAQRAKLGATCRAVLTRLTERENAAVALPVTLYLDQFDAVKEQVGDKITSLTENLLKSSGFGHDLAKCEVQSAHGRAHCQLIQAGAFAQSAYREKVFAFLKSLNKETWEEVIWQETDTYNLLVLGFRNGWTASTELEDAVDEVGLKVSGTEPPERSWSDVPHDWNDVFDNLNAQRRGTAARKIVDLLGHRVPDDLHPVIALFGNDLAKAFAEGNNNSLVRQIAEPIVKNGDQQQIKWLGAAVQHGQKFWESAPDDDRSTFSQSLWQRVSGDENDGITELLRQIAKSLTLQEPVPVDGKPAEEGEQAENGNADP